MEKEIKETSIRKLQKRILGRSEERKEFHRILSRLKNADFA
jgi:hypothetical protein